MTKKSTLLDAVHEFREGLAKLPDDDYENGILESYIKNGADCIVVVTAHVIRKV